MAVDRNYVINKMRGRMMTPQEFNFDALQAPPLYSLLTPTDVGDLNKLATSIRYSGNPILRLDRIDQILRNRGFRKFAGGTNRVVYKFLEDDSFIIKVASDAVGVGDNPREWINQHHYKPFVTKVFEVSPCGTVGLFEKVIPITSREEFLTIASDYYDVVRNWFTGEFVMDDIGTDYFMNVGIRKGFGPVLLDFPYSYKLDGNKLYCNIPNSNNPSIKCGGVIDYDDGFNHLRCTKCGAVYRAKELAKAVENETVIIKGGISKMKVSFGYGDDVRVVNNTNGLDTAPKLTTKTKKKSVVGTLKAVAVGGRNKIVDRSDAKEEVSNKPNRSDEIDGFLGFSGEITNTHDIDNNFDESFKCICLMDGENGDLLTKDNRYVIVTHLAGIPLSDYSILTKEAYDAIIRKINDAKDLENEMINLKNDNIELTDQLTARDTMIDTLHDSMDNMSGALSTAEMAIEDYKERIDALVASVKELSEENDKLKESLNNSSKEIKDLEIKSRNLEAQLRKEPWYINSSGNKIDRKTGKRWVETQSDEDIKFDVSSPLIPETNEEIKNDIQDKEIVRKIDEILPDIDESEDADSEKESTEQNGVVEVQEAPVGSISPNNHPQGNKNQQPRGYKDNYTNKKGKKGNKRRG